MPKEKVETNKDKLLSDVLTEIEREYGKGSVMKLGDRAAVDVSEHSFDLDGLFSSSQCDCGITNDRKRLDC